MLNDYHILHKKCNKEICDKSSSLKRSSRITANWTKKYVYMYFFSFIENYNSTIYQ